MIRRVLAVGVALLLLTVPAAATETEDPGAAVEPEIAEPAGEDPAGEQEPETETVTSETIVDDKNITVNVTLPAATSTEPVEPAVLDEPIEEEPEALAYSVTALDELADPSDEGAAALKETITDLIGTYTPRTQTVTEYLSDGSVIEYQQIVPGLAGLDYPWLAAATFFGLLLFCFFKILGGLIKL